MGTAGPCNDCMYVTEGPNWIGYICTYTHYITVFGVRGTEWEGATVSKSLAIVRNDYANDDGDGSRIGGLPSVICRTYEAWDGVTLVGDLK